MRSNPERDAWLRERLREAVAVHANGSADKFGRMLGYTNGGYIREILDGKKPLRSAIIERAASVKALQAWFDYPGAAASAGDAAPRSFSSLSGQEAQLVMLARELDKRSPHGGVEALCGLAADLADVPDERMAEAINGAMSAIASAHYGTNTAVKHAGPPLAVSPPSPGRRTSPQTPPTESHATTSRRSVK